MRTFAEKPKATQQTTSAKSTIPSRAHFGQSREVNSILHLQRTIGNQAVQRMLQTNDEELEVGLASTASPCFAHDFSQIPLHPKSPANVQAKLTVDPPGDIYEQEADRVSEQITHMPELQVQRAGACGGGCPKCQTDQPGREPESMQTKRVQASDTGEMAVPPTVHEALRSLGQPLDTSTRESMESRFGHDFSQVRVHADGKAAESAQAVQALAYTVGSDVVFADSRFSPATNEGKKLLAHELTHVVQQSKGTKAIQRAPDKNWHVPTTLSLNPESEQPGYQSTLNADAQKSLDDKREKDEELERNIQNARALFRAHHSGHDEDVLDTIDAALDRATEGNPDLLLAFYRYYYRHGFADNMKDKDKDNTGLTDSGDTIINPRVLELNSDFPTDSALRLLGGTLIHEFAHTPQESNTINVPEEAFAYGVEFVLSERMMDEKRMQTIANRYNPSKPDPFNQLGNGIPIYEKTKETMHTLYKVIDAGGQDAEEARRMSVLFISRTADPEKYPPELNAFLSKVSP
ncbi:MAG: DUF4157 domain-containing protein [Blastocatellia bacterium]